MLSIRKPTPEMIRAFLEKQRALDFTYQPVGVTESESTDNNLGADRQVYARMGSMHYVRDRTRVRLGFGQDIFITGSRALRNWQHFQLGWVEAWPADMPIREGQLVAVLARCFKLWWLNACRIMYVIDDESRIGFAYGTLPDHAASGEERFLIEMDQAGNVFYDILAISRPRHFLARMGYPIMRRVQKQFARQSAVAMQRAVEVV